MTTIQQKSSPSNNLSRQEAGGKRRTVLTEGQRLYLETRFRENHYITSQIKQEIASLLELPELTPTGKIIVDRIQSILADCKSIDLINEELSRSLTDLRSLRDVLRNSLETVRNGEKEVCLAMAGLLKKISVNSVKLTDSQKNLDSIWNYWSEFIPQDENRAYSLSTLNLQFKHLIIKLGKSSL
nr:NK2 homeobox 8 [Hymenolepis microstoma]